MSDKYLVAVNEKYYPRILEIPDEQIARTLFGNLKCKDDFGKIYLCKVICEKEG